MKITVLQPPVASAIRRAAENPNSVSGVIFANTATATKKNTTSITVPGIGLLRLNEKALQVALGEPDGEEIDYGILKLVAQKFVLPAIKTAFPQTTSVVTGVQIIWASADLWKTMSNNEVDTTKAVIKTFDVAQRAVELVLQVNDVPTLAIQSNQIAGFALTTADAVYALQLKRTGKEKRLFAEIGCDFGVVL